MKNTGQPKWWRLYAILPVGVALMTLDARLVVPGWEHKLVEIGIVVVVFALMAWWLMANAVALSHAEAGPDSLRVVTYDPRTERRRNGGDARADEIADSRDADEAHRLDRTEWWRI